MAYDPATQEIVLFGGNPMGHVNSAPNDTWTFDGKAWTERTVQAAPPGRAEAAMAYDPQTKQVVLFGGIDVDGTPLADTWLWDGSSWHMATPSAKPPVRNLPAVAYDDAIGRIVMFGGWNPAVGGPAKLNDTWEWTGSNWEQVYPATVPEKLGGASLAYDPVGRRLVLFGGDDGSPTNRMWSFDGTNWSEIPFARGASRPAAREAFVMSTDYAHDDVLLFGGEEAVGGGTDKTGEDTWSWDGSTWKRLSPGNVPPARGIETLEGSIAFDASTGRIVLYGGFSGSGQPLGDTWTWDGNNWSKVADNSGCTATPATR